MEKDVTDTSRQSGEIVKEQGLLRSLDFFFRMLEPAGHDDEEVISATSNLQDPLAAILTHPKCRRWVNQRARIGVGQEGCSRLGGRWPERFTLRS